MDSDIQEYVKLLERWNGRDKKKECRKGRKEMKSGRNKENSKFSMLVLF
jgi:hypothetical protein